MFLERAVVKKLTWDLVQLFIEEGNYFMLFVVELELQWMSPLNTDLQMATSDFSRIWMSVALLLHT